MDLKQQKNYRLSFWQQWLIHGFILWFVLTAYDLFTYWASVQRNGYFLFYADGSPVTVWQRFFMHNFDDLLWLGVLIAAYFIEAAYHFVFRKLKRINIITGGVLAVGLLLFFALNAFDTARRGGDVMNSLVGLMYVLISSSIYAFMYAIIRDYIYRKIHTAELHSEQSRAELNTLKAQVNPHFFFNTLNSIYGTALEENATRTSDSLEELSNIMRYTMNEAQQDFTAVANEIKFIEDYLHLQHLRLPDRNNIKIKTDINYKGESATLAPMLLIPFIENAYKYGISIDKDCWVHIQLNIKDQQLHLLTSNKILKENNHSKSMGTGIENTRKRLQLLYPEKHQLHIYQNEEFIVDLKIDLK